MGTRSIQVAIIAALTLCAGSIVNPAATAELSHNSRDRWSGFYAGGHVGHHDINTSGLFDWPEPAGSPDLSNIGDNGLHAGVQAGYDWQWNRLVFGVEVDASWGGFDKRHITIQDGSPSEAGLFSYPIVGDLDYLATVRGRVGFHAAGLIGPDLLLFVTGGAAFTNFDMDIADGRSNVGFHADGTIVGGGIEMALSDQWSLAAEYLHHHFNERLDIEDVAISGIFDANTGDYVTLDNVDIFRIALNFKFNK